MRIWYLLMVFCLFAASGLSAQAAPPRQIVVSIAPQKYFVERIAGDNVQVTVLAGSGSDPHSFEPTPAQMRACAKADVLFVLGVPFEAAWLPRISGAAPTLDVVSMLAEQSAPSAEPQAAAAHKDTHGHAHEPGEDPHVWLSPAEVQSMLPVIESTLARLMPGKAAFFAANAQAFSQEISQLQERLHKAFAPYPEERRVFLSFHPAWGHFAEEFHVREYSIETGGKEPSPRLMKTLIDTSREHSIRVVFIEPQFSKSAARTIAQSLNARVVSVDPLQEDWPALIQTFGEALAASFAEMP